MRWNCVALLVGKVPDISLCDTSGFATERLLVYGENQGIIQAATASNILIPRANPAQRTAGRPSADLTRSASEIAQALALGAMGLLVSILAVWCFNYLHSRIEVFEGEMSNAELEAVTCLEAHPQWGKRLNNRIRHDGF
jgi:MotA/TolQ/ExbB proton channel family